MGRRGGIHALEITAGVIASARLGSGGAGAGAKFLADDKTFKTVDLSSYLTQTSADARYLQLSGGTLTGPITGTGGLIEQRSGVTSQVNRLYHTYTDASNYDRSAQSFTTYSGVRWNCWKAESAGTGATNISMAIMPRGNGAFSLQVPDGTSAGGNARGAYAVDLQLVRSAANQVASGISSFISGQYNLVSGAYSSALGYINTVSGGGSLAAGYSNTITGNWNGAIGWGNTVTGGSSGGCFATGRINSINVSDNSTAFVAGILSSVTNHAGFAHGIYGSSTRYNQYTHGGDFFSAALGGAQYIRLLAGNKTTTNTPVNLMLDGSTARLTIPSGKTMTGFLIVKGIKSDGSAKARFVRLVDITNVGGTTTLDTAVETIGTDYNPSACTLAVTAENATDDLQVNITGPAGETWRWVATFSGLEIAYGT